MRVLEANDALAHKAKELIASPTEFFQVPVGNGVTLDGWIIKPPDFDAKKKYPVLVYIYGEPAGATVTDAWGGSRRLFHELIARQGYLVVSFDNQGTPAPKGREWRKLFTVMLACSLRCNRPKPFANWPRSAPILIFRAWRSGDGAAAAPTR